jgi:uncharacterized protein
VKALQLAPYHLFQYRGSNYAFDIDSSFVMQLDNPAYDALALRLEGIALPTIAEHLEASYGSETAQTVLSELRWLEAQGIFQAPISTYDDKENEAYIQRLTGMATSNIELCLAEACNLRCRYCYVAENDALNNGLMPWEIAQQAVDLIFRRSGKSKSIGITFFGGEPLLNKPVLRQVIDYSQRLGAEQGKQVGYSMTTNGTLLDDEIIGLIKRYNFGLMVSLDGPKEVHDRIRPMANGQGSFERATAGIKLLMERRSAVTVRCTLSNQCLDRPRIVDFLEEFGFSRVAMSRCSGTADHLGDYDIGPQENAVLREQDDTFLDRLLEQLERGERIRFNPWAMALRHIHNKASRRMRCGVGRGCTTVGIDGSLYPCHRYVGMAPFVIGHVSTGVDQEKFADYLRGYFETKAECESCWAINLCGGYCPWYVSCQDGSFQPPQDWWCQETLGWLEQGIWLYDTLRSRFPTYLQQVVGQNGQHAASPKASLR